MQPIALEIKIVVLDVNDNSPHLSANVKQITVDGSTNRLETPVVIYVRDEDQPDNARVRLSLSGSAAPHFRLDDSDFSA